MPRTIAGNSEIFTFAIRGDLDGIKSLLSQGLASPFDVCESNGGMALRYAAGYNHRDISQFLIDTGADTNLEDKEQATPITLFWVRIFKGLLDQRSVDAWRVMFDDEDYLESRTFPILHKIVLHLSGADLRQQLELSTSTINDQDSEGRTALSWAAARNDVEAVKLLLEFRADPNRCPPRGQSPLHAAAQNPSTGSAETLRALLEAGAVVNCVDYWRRSALLYAGCNQEDPKCLEHLIRTGADLNVQDCRERTPLGYAARMAKNRVATPYLRPEHNSHDTIRCLFQCGTSLTAKTHDGRTILQQAAIHGDIPTLRILANHDVRGTDLSDDEDCRTAQDLISKRNDVDAARENAFHALLGAFLRYPGAAAIRSVVCGSDVGDTDDDGEEFFDTCEQRDPETAQ